MPDVLKIAFDVLECGKNVRRIDCGTNKNTVACTGIFLGYWGNFFFGGRGEKGILLWRYIDDFSRTKKPPDGQETAWAATNDSVQRCGLTTPSGGFLAVGWLLQLIQNTTAPPSSAKPRALPHPPHAQHTRHSPVNEHPLNNARRQ